jgi:hypothetical protein
MAAESTRYTEKAIRRKMENGMWLRGILWTKAPDGCINLETVAFWIGNKTGRQHSLVAQNATKVPNERRYKMKWVTIKKAAELSGYSETAIRRKREEGVWLQGDIWIKTPDGRILISIEGIEGWAEGQMSVPQLQYRSVRS